MYRYRVLHAFKCGRQRARLAFHVSNIVAENSARNKIIINNVYYSHLKLEL